MLDNSTPASPKLAPHLHDSAPGRVIEVMIARAFSLLALAAVSTAAQTPPAIQRVFPCAPADTPQMAQELVNILRAIGNITQVSYYYCVINYSPSIVCRHLKQIG